MVQPPVVALGAEMPNQGAQGGPTARMHDYYVGVCGAAVHPEHTGYADEQVLGRTWAIPPCRGPEAVGTPPQLRAHRPGRARQRQRVLGKKHLKDFVGVLATVRDCVVRGAATDCPQLEPTGCHLQHDMNENTPPTPVSCTKEVFGHFNASDLRPLSRALSMGSEEAGFQNDEAEGDEAKFPWSLLEHPRAQFVDAAPQQAQAQAAAGPA
eukprot:1201798-Amphidinium_carterae.1